MLNVSGYAVISEIKSEKQINNGTIFFLEIVSLNRRKKPTPENPLAMRTYHKLSLFVNDNLLNEARKTLKHGVGMIINHADLTSNKTENNIYSELFAYWTNILFLKDKVPVLEDNK